MTSLPSNGSPSFTEPAQQFWQRWRQGPPPTPQEFLAASPQVTPAELVAILQVDQRERWSRGERVLVEDYLQAWPILRDHEEVFLDLIYSEKVVREETDEPGSLEEYLRRFPPVAAQLQRQFALDEVLDADAPAADGEHTVTHAGTFSPLQNQQTMSPETVDRTGSHAPAAASPERIGKYLVVGALDEGGQGSVYRAVHPALGQEVAIKWSRYPLSADPRERDRLLAEGRTLAELRHPNLVSVYDMDVHQDRPFVVLEYVPGRHLEQYARQEAPPPRQAAALVAQVARALAVAHRRGIVHQDVKPRNIVIDEAGQPRLIDFGLARLQHAWVDDPAAFGTLMGTVQYMAPEQARTIHVDVGPQSDIFALGGVLYFLLVGRAPFAGVDFHSTLDRAQRGDWDQDALVAAHVPPRLEAICRKALANKPTDRHTRAEDLAAELEAFAQRRPLPLRLLAGAAFLVVVALVGLAGWWAGWWLRPSAPANSSPDRLVSLPRTVPVFKSSLSVRVWRKSRFHDLVNVVPLHSGDELRIQTEVPAHWHASLFLFTSEGNLKRLRAVAPANTAQLVSYPQQENKSVLLIGPPGTEMLLVCASPSGPISEETIRKLWTGEGSWTLLPGATVLRLEPDRVRVEQTGRDLGPARTRADPEGAVRRRLETLRLRLRDRFDHFEGLLFVHQ